MTFIKPMEPVATSTVNTSSDYLFQVKWDGIRIIAEKHDAVVRLYTRRGRVRTDHYPELVRELSQLPSENFTLDGELIALNRVGKPDFQRILKRNLAKRIRSDIPIGYMVFDCLHKDGQDLYSVPLENRQSELRVLLGRQQLHFISACENYADGQALFNQMDALGMEGVVGKKRGSIYVPGQKVNLWQKTKCWREIEVTGMAVNYREGRPASITVAQQVEDEWQVVGAVATGLNQTLWQQILNLQGSVSRPEDGQVPLEPGCVMRVRFLEWTHEGRLRAPTVLDVRV